MTEYQRYYVRLERQKTDSWIETYLVITIPTRNHPDYQQIIRDSLESQILQLYPNDWELVTYGPEDSETPQLDTL